MENQDITRNSNAKDKHSRSTEAGKPMEEKDKKEGISGKKKASAEKSEEAQDETKDKDLEAEDTGNTLGPESKRKEDSKDEESFKSKYFYLAAEMENYKRRMQKEKENLLKFGNEKILLDLVDVVDNFERTVDALKNEEDEKIKNILAGIDMVKKQFNNILQKHGLVMVEAVGKEFDPNFHEAVSQRHVEDKEDQIILEEYQKGYLLNGRLLRPSKVVVAKTE